MRLTLIALGSTGDVRPCLLLGKELQSRGHGITLCAFEDFRKAACDCGFSFHPFSGNAHKYISHLMNGAAGVKYLNQLRLSLKDEVLTIISDLEDACKDTDAIISTYFGNISQSIAEEFSLPLIQLRFYPMDRTRDFPIASAPALFDNPLGSLASYRLGFFLEERVEQHYASSWRKSRDLRMPSCNSRRPYESMGHTIPVLYSISPHILPRPADWGSNIHLTGCWMEKQEADFQPDPALEAFLSAGSPPVYIGFGSVINQDMARSMTIILKSLEAANLRAVVSKGWSQASLPDSDRIFEADYVPHQWLFSRVSAVVHHGGAGTTAAGLQAGKPTLVISFGGDQPFWGSRVHALEAGPAPIPWKKLNEKRLTKALLELTGEQRYTKKAAELGKLLREEKGVENAADLVEKEFNAWLSSESR